MNVALGVLFKDYQDSGFWILDSKSKKVSYPEEVGWGGQSADSRKTTGGSAKNEKSWGEIQTPY